jgi:hypothetical protein
MLVRKELLSPEWAERILSWRHTGFSVHSRVRAKTKPEAERVGKYMIRTVLSLERLSFLEPESKVGYRYGQDARDQETMDYLEFIARVTSHIPDKGQVMVRYYGLYANAHRGKVRKVVVSPLTLRMSEEDRKPVPSKGWAAMIRKVYEKECRGARKSKSLSLRSMWRETFWRRSRRNSNREWRMACGRSFMRRPKKRRRSFLPSFQFKERWEKEVPSAVKSLENSLDACLTFFKFPPEEWQALRTTNIIERLNKEFKRRTKTMEIVTGENACYRLVAFISLKMEMHWKKNPMGQSSL